MQAGPGLVVGDVAPSAVLGSPRSHPPRQPVSSVPHPHSLAATCYLGRERATKWLVECERESMQHAPSFRRSEKKSSAVGFGIQSIRSLPAIATLYIYFLDARPHVGLTRQAILATASCV
jgi:hypothetical protein